MKNIVFTLMLATVLWSSCQDEVMTDIMQEQEVEDPATRAITSWNQCQKAILKSGEEVSLPWATTASTNIPDDVRQDVKEENGWKVLFSTMEFVGYDINVTSVDKGVNYLLLYNIYTGVLKGFVYLEDFVGKNNTAFWQLSAQPGSTLLNFTPEFAEAIDSQNSPESVSLSTITTNGLTKGFDRGWNCFMQELAYDPGSKDQTISITAYVLDNTTFTFSGAYKSTSEGTIVSSNQRPSNVLNGIADVSGKHAKQWIADNTGENNRDKPIKFSADVLQTVVDEGVTGLVKTGLYKVFGKLLGVSQTNYSMQVTTSGTVEITGTSSQPSSGMVPPLAGIPLGGLGHDLGLWNLSTKPIYYTQTFSEYKDFTSSGDGLRAYFGYEVITYPSIQTRINPIAYKNGQSTVSVAATPVEYLTYHGEKPQFYESYVDPKNKYKYGAEQYSFPPIIYDDDDTYIRDGGSVTMIYVQDLLPNRRALDDIKKAGLSFKDARVNIWKNIVLRVKAQTKDAAGNTVYSVKSFIPTQQFDGNTGMPYTWTLDAMRQAGYQFY